MTKVDSDKIARRGKLSNISACRGLNQDYIQKCAPSRRGLKGPQFNGQQLDNRNRIDGNYGVQ